MSDWLSPRRLAPDLVLAVWVILVAGLYLLQHALPAGALARAVVGG